ncbi:MAG: metallophosphoesterase family protein [Prolixibacteraceae bacterium]
MPNRLFAIGDIHGCFDPLQELVENHIRLSKSDTLVLLGDYIDRGPKVKEVADYILELRKNGYNVITLKGNHEDMLLNALDNKRHLPVWLFNGGDKTLESFGVRGVENIGPEYLEFFRNLRYYYTDGNYIFVHAGFNNNALDPFHDKYNMLWECRSSYSHPQLKDKIIVHGHCVITAQEFEKQMSGKPQVIRADTGCVYKEHPGYGNLAAIELHSGKSFLAKC